MRQSITRTLAIRAPAPEVIAWISRPENLPDLYQNIVGSCPTSGTRAAKIIHHDKPVPVEVIVDPSAGTVDYFWHTSGGAEVAAVRVIPVDGESQVVVTFFEPPESCPRCTSLEERSAAVESDLLLMKALMESTGRKGAEVWH